jgi:hypothetical protein
MKRDYLLTIALITITLFGYGQNKKKTKIDKDPSRPVWVLLNTGEKIEGELKEQLFIQNIYVTVTQNGVSVKRTYNAKDVVEFKIGTYKYISDGKYFYKELINGKKASLYVKNKIVNSPGMAGTGGTFSGGHSSVSEDYYVTKPETPEMTRVKKTGFKKKMAKYFEDCDSLKKDILNGRYNYSRLNHMVLAFNTCK